MPFEREASRRLEVTLGQAALLGGIGVLVMLFTAPFAELTVYGRLAVPGEIEETYRNLITNQGLFLAAILAYLTTFVCDVVVAWAFCVLLSPVDRSLSLLAAWFRVLHAVLAMVALSKLATAYRLVAGATTGGLDAAESMLQIHLLLGAFKDHMVLAMVVFAIHLGLVGWLVYSSGYVPRLLGVLLAIAGAGFLVHALGPLLAPHADLGFVMVAFVGEVIFMVWLLVRGWRLDASAPG